MTKKEEFEITYTLKDYTLVEASTLEEAMKIAAKKALKKWGKKVAIEMMINVKKL